MCDRRAGAELDPRRSFNVSTVEPSLTCTKKTLPPPGCSGARRESSARFTTSTPGAPGPPSSLCGEKYAASRAHAKVAPGDAVGASADASAGTTPRAASLGRSAPASCVANA